MIVEVEIFIGTYYLATFQVISEHTLHKTDAIGSVHGILQEVKVLSFILQYSALIAIQGVNLLILLYGQFLNRVIHEFIDRGV